MELRKMTLIHENVLVYSVLEAIQAKKVSLFTFIDKDNRFLISLLWKSSHKHIHRPDSKSITYSFG